MGTNGHVQITMKRYDGRSKPIPKSNSKKDCKGKVFGKGSKSSNDLKSKSDSTSNESGEHMCLIRAVCRKKKFLVWYMQEMLIGFKSHTAIFLKVIWMD